MKKELPDDFFVILRMHVESIHQLLDFEELDDEDFDSVCKRIDKNLRALRLMEKIKNNDH